MQYRRRRRETSFVVTLDTDQGKRRADIVDVTEQGARLRLEKDGIDPDSEVTLAIRGKAHKARVIWNKDGEAGVHFKEMLPLKVLAAISRTLHRPDLGKKKK